MLTVPNQSSEKSSERQSMNDSMLRVVESIAEIGKRFSEYYRNSPIYVEYPGPDLHESVLFEDQERRTITLEITLIRNEKKFTFQLPVFQSLLNADTKATAQTEPNKEQASSPQKGMVSQFASFFYHSLV